MIHATDLRELVIRPTLKYVDLWSQAAENLLVGTWFQESSIAGSTRLKQVKGPALGGYQIEPATHKDNWIHFLRYPQQNRLRDLVLSLVPPNGFNSDGCIKDSELIWNLPYATVQARIKYYRVPDPIPAANDLLALAAYWNEFYNANPIHGHDEDWIRNYPK